MASHYNIRLPTTQVDSVSATEIFVPATRWGDSAGIGQARTYMEMRGRYGNALVTPAYQLCNDDRNPDAALAIQVLVAGAPGWANADGTFDVSTSLTAIDTVSRRLIRFGWLVKLASGTNGGASVSGIVQAYY